MTPILYIILGLIVVLVIASLIWCRDALPCPTWLNWMVEVDNPFTEVNHARITVGLLGLAPGMKALDIQEGMLACVRVKVEASGLGNVRFVQAGQGEGKLPQNYFDRALLVTVLGEIPDQAAALKEIYGALKPGGLLSVTEVIFDPHFQRRETELCVAQTAGFREKNFFGRSLAYTLHLEKSPTG